MPFIAVETAKVCRSWCTCKKYARIPNNNYKYSEILKSTEKYAKIIENILLRRL
jgi:hypothetical protein